MHSDFWTSRWEQNKIGFHQGDVNRYLRDFFPELHAPAGSRVLVPLCGKSLDMIWLRDNGYRVLGAELSEIAVEAFFEENGMAPDKTRQGTFTSYRSGEIEILQGDFFALRPADMTGTSSAYDRAALIALPENMRGRYIRQMGKLLPSGSRTLLISIEYPQEQMGGPPFSVPETEIRERAGDEFDVRLLSTADALAENPRFAGRGVTELAEKAYILERR